MNLKEAIEWGERHKGDILSDFKVNFDELLAAAKRQLEREEKDRPKRASLADLEIALRHRATLMRVGDMIDTDMLDAASILKALREVVVPWLKLGVEMTPPKGTWLSVEGEMKYQADLLRALGEEVP